jgi:hypothetical protein
MIRRRPFVPFRIHVSDGTTYTIQHPELVMTGIAAAIVGLPTDPTQPFLFGRSEVVDLRHMVRLEPLEAPTPGNGQP